MRPLPWRWRLVHWLALHLPRGLAFWLGIRRRSPRGDKWPWWTVVVPRLPVDTGGAFRAAWRPQDPSLDPREPGGGESSAAGNDHGWSNCTMSSGAMALAYQRAPNQGSLAPWGGDLRHRQSDLSGGTDLYDVRTAWASYGETLTIRTGAGWAAVVEAHEDGRAIVIQGEGNVPGSQTFDGGHGCVIAPETHSNGQWLFGDPLATGWQWVSVSSIKTWAQAMSSSVYFAVGELPPATPPPDPPKPPTPTPPPPPPGPDYGDGYLSGLEDGVARAADAVFASWRPGEPWPPDLSGPTWDLGAWEEGVWVRPWPYPLLALRAAMTPAAWGASAWTAAVWRDVTDPPPDPAAGTGAWDVHAWPVLWDA